jgi:type I site-specific restriction-modification system R (restriction) subunit
MEFRLVVIELKNAADENATIHSAFRQIETYKAIIPGLFTYNGFVVISDGLEAKAGSLSAGFSRFMAWKTADGKSEASHLVGQLETLIQGMLNKETLLDLIRHFIVFEKSRKEDPKRGSPPFHHRQENFSLPSILCGKQSGGIDPESVRDIKSPTSKACRLLPNNP